MRKSKTRNEVNITACKYAEKCCHHNAWWCDFNSAACDVRRRNECAEHDAAGKSAGKSAATPDKQRKKAVKQ
nr:MAG TPA: hypothetical protein [Caudoviricetes sp.]